MRCSRLNQGRELRQELVRLLRLTPGSKLRQEAAKLPLKGVWESSKIVLSPTPLILRDRGEASYGIL